MTALKGASRLQPRTVKRSPQPGRSGARWQFVTRCAKVCIHRGVADNSGRVYRAAPASGFALPGGTALVPIVQITNLGEALMGETVELHTNDGKQIAAYVARPQAAGKAGIVVVQEIFGVNSHIKSVTDRFASAGYLSIAPAFFDRLEPGVDMGYEAKDIAAGRELGMALKPEGILADLNAGIAWLRAAGCSKVGVVGFCLGGTVAWRAASSTDVDAAVGYYGGGIIAQRDNAPRVPVMLHFGSKDSYIPIEPVHDLARQYPDIPIHIYDADHGFHCDQRGSYDAAAAKLAYARTLEFFAEHLA